MFIDPKTDQIVWQVFGIFLFFLKKVLFNGFFG